MLIAPPTSADSHPVNTPSAAFQTAGGALLLALTSYACLHVQSSSFLCMSSLEVLSSLHFFMFLVFTPCALTLRSLLICFPFYLTFGKTASPSPPPALDSFSGYCVHTASVRCILSTSSLKEGALWRWGTLCSWTGAGSPERNLKQYLSSLAPVPLCRGEPEHTERTRSTGTEQEDRRPCSPL